MWDVIKGIISLLPGLFYEIWLSSPFRRRGNLTTKRRHDFPTVTQSLDQILGFLSSRPAFWRCQYEGTHTKHWFTNTQVNDHRLSEVFSPCSSSPRPLASPSSHPPLLFLWSCHIFSFNCTVLYLLCLMKLQALSLIHLRDHSLTGYLFLIWMECFLPSPWPIHTMSFIHDCGCFLRWYLVLESFIHIGPCPGGRSS